MGYLDNRTITVDAILTKKGRQLLAQGKEFFKITKFALSDDEVDYHLWNPAHPSGSNYYGYAIEQMPVLEPSPDETQVMRYKLVSLDRNTTKLPVVYVQPVTITFRQGESADIAPGTSYVGGGSVQPNLNGQYGYTCILHNSDVAYLSVIDAAPASPIDALETQLARLQKQLDDMRTAGTAAGADVEDQILELRREITGRRSRELMGAGAGMFLGDTESAKSIFAVGMKFRLTAKQLTSRSSLSTTITIIGNETGGSATISVTNNRIKVEER